MTLREVWLVLDGFNWQRQEGYKLLAWQAWHIVAFKKAKKFPSLKQVLGFDSKRKTQTVEEQIIMAKLITQAMGGDK